MGKLHWERHNKKPAPIKTEDIGDNLRLVVRERETGQPGSTRAIRMRASERFVATIRYIKPPVPGQFVKLFAYGPTPEQAEVRVLANALAAEGVEY